jgi:hypothetical protein
MSHEEMCAWLEANDEMITQGMGVEWQARQANRARSVQLSQLAASILRNDRDQVSEHVMVGHGHSVTSDRTVPGLVPGSGDTPSTGAAGDDYEPKMDNGPACENSKDGV